MLFGEKYGGHRPHDWVRVECRTRGGTHVGATGEIGLFRITSESAAKLRASGASRPKPVNAPWTAPSPSATCLRRTTEVLKGPVRPGRRRRGPPIQGGLPPEGSRRPPQGTGHGHQAPAARRHPPPGWRWHTGHARHGGFLDAGAIKDIAFQLKAEAAPLYAVFGSRAGGKADHHVPHHRGPGAGKGMECRTARPGMGRHIQGGGGGQPFFATAGGKEGRGHPGRTDAARASLQRAGNRLERDQAKAVSVSLL